MTDFSGISLIDRAHNYGSHSAIIDQENRYSYQTLLEKSGQAAACLLNGRSDLEEARVAFLMPRGFPYVAVQWAIWQAGGLAVPLCDAHPKPELAYVIQDSQASIVVGHPDFEDILRPLAQELKVPYLSTEALYDTPPTTLPMVDPRRRAMMVYTSGTTGRPKGVVTTHQNIEAQVTALVAAWGWSVDDSILNILPLHHVHGIINVLTCALWSGARCEFLPKFDAAAVWERLASGDLTLFMAVPTIYSRLIRVWDAASPEQQQAMSKGCNQLRLMVSGSAALPVSTLEKWQQISGHTLLERYGMTEIGMALSNPLYGERVPGHVGTPLPTVEIRRVDEEGNLAEPDTPGEIQVKGPSVFLEYFGRPEATAEAFVDGWFRSGDIAIVEEGNYRILGRNSVDIIKTGGYKVSALEIEEVLRTHPDITECAVVGVEDPDWGEAVSAALVMNPGQLITLDTLRAWCKERLAAYKVPSRLLIMDDLPRNAMGKVTKPNVTAAFQKPAQP